MNEYAPLLEAVRAIHRIPEGPVPLHAPIFKGREREYVLDTIDSTFVSSVGEYVNRFEGMLREITSAKHAVACVNGTAALQVALVLAGVKPGDLVITQAVSFVATANAISHAGGEPVFLDISPVTLGLSPEALKLFLEQECRMQGKKCVHKATGQHVAACVPMHTFGLPCDIDSIAALCTEHGIPVVEDAAEALGSTYKGQHCGTFGLLGTLSFNGNKIVTTGGGGAIITDDSELGRLAKHITTTAKIPHRWEFRHDLCAWNFRLPNLNAALGCAQLEQLGGFIEHKRNIAKAYGELLAGLPWEFVPEPAHSRSNYWLCAVRFSNKKERDAFLTVSNDAGIMTRPCWEPLQTLPMYAERIKGPLQHAEQATATIVNLPSGVSY